jgi:hypothetical protein
MDPQASALGRSSLWRSCCVAASLLTALAMLAGPAATSATAATPEKTDVMFLFDTSGSMSGALGEAKEEIDAVVDQLSATTPDVAFGVANVEDYPFYDEGALFATLTESEYEEDPEKPWRLDQPVTTEQSKVFTAIEALSGSSVEHGGGDGPEAYGRALWETDTNPSVGWRAGARHLIVLIADQVPHNPNVDEGISEEFWAEPSPWNTGEELPGRWGIPGTQLKEGETLNFDDVLQQLAGDGKPLEMVDYHDTEGDFVHYWEHWAAIAGGQAFEANEGGHEFASKLINAVEHAPEDTACATTAIPTSPSPATPDGLPTALTPRFLQPGTTIVATPSSGKVFCAGQDPALGASVVSYPQQATGEKLVFEVPPTAANGMELTSLDGGLGLEVPFEVDNFRYPWGFSIANAPGKGGGNTYDDDSKIITPEDLESVFHLVNLHFLDLGYRESAAYEEAEQDAAAVLEGGLCYGFTLLSWELYLDAHGQSKPLGWAGSKAFALAPGSLPYAQTELEAGSHGLTHALMRAAMSQYSPEAMETWKTVTSASNLKDQLNTPFAKGQPVPLLIFFAGGGHAMLAFNYQPTSGGGANVDVVDPNVPFGEGNYRRPEAEAYPILQVKVSPNGSWTFTGSFGSGTFGNPVSGGPGSLQVVPEPRLPGGLLLPSSSLLARFWTYIHPQTGGTVSAISYSTASGHGIPADAKPEEIFNDAPDNRLMVPSKHHTVTVTIDPPAGAAASVNLTGYGFIDSAALSNGQHNVTVGSQTGELGLPVAMQGTMLSVTRVVDGVQRTASARFTGKVNDPVLSVSNAGQVTISTAGGSGHVSIELATYMPNGEQAHARPERLSLHGRAHIHRHTPKIRRRRRSKHRHPKR